MLERRTTFQITKDKTLNLDFLYFLRIDLYLTEILPVKVTALIMSISYPCGIMLERRTTSQITKNEIFNSDLLYFLRID